MRMTLSIFILVGIATSSAYPQDSSTAPHCTDICPAIYAPVCGSDGKTYSNDCALRAAGCRGTLVYKIKDGECEGSTASPCSDVCPEIYAPVCGSDGNTYSNDCELRAASCRGTLVYKIKDGACEGSTAPPCADVCPQIYAPVCGSDGNTYSNDCELSAASCRGTLVYKIKDGECEGSTAPPCADVCPQIYAPVCGSDGNTYSNDCELRAASCRGTLVYKIKDGECEDMCRRFCSRELKPVCGSNGQTYNNQCLLELAACSDPSISLVHEGPCGNPGGNGCQMFCTKEFLPVCGSNGQTFNNKCLLEEAACNDPTISLVHAGPCGTLPSQGYLPPKATPGM
ncbi:hypothetical protein SK128_017211 [Halocaridina rubra]|uniref:Kazal-like domain-containing protein n=1 Tax=Halocaridina rubra TaxID=373956 RepID=A0AAN8WVX9_HALRR